MNHNYPIKRLLINVAFFIAILGLISPLAMAIYVRFYQGFWPSWSGFGDYQPPTDNFQRAKTLWDLFQLIVVPGMLALVALIFNALEGRTERAIALEKSRETSLQAYLDHMTDLLKKGDVKSNKFNEARAIARARTLTTLRSLDGERRGIIIRFLYESGLLKGKNPLNIKGASLIDANLKNSDLSGVDLHGTDLTGANLTNSNLSEANLHGTDLTGAKFYNSILHYVNLAEAQLIRANLLIPTYTKQI